MEPEEILRAESPCLEEGKGNGISERHLKRRRRSGSASDRARFRLIGKQQDIIGVAGQKTIAPLRHTRNRDPMPRSEQDDIVQLGRFAGVGKGDDRVMPRHHPQITVAGLSGMDELGGRASGSEGRGHFSGYVPAFSHARDRDAPGNGQKTTDDFIE